jgi:NAD+ synthase (glutamine-hydrolysing)
MKIVLAQQNYHIGNFEQNRQKIITAIGEAKQQQADLVVFSECCVCGYPARDFLEFEDFVRQCYESIEIIKAYADTIGVVVGSPFINPQREGKDLFNSAWLLYEKEVKQVVHKTLLPNYDVFDEYRYFEPAYEWSIVKFRGKKIALTICEDIWNLGDNPMYRLCPMDYLMEQQPDFMINISASPFDYDHDNERKEIIRNNVLKYRLPMFYCNAVGAQTEVVFDGSSLIFDAKGNLVQELPAFKETTVMLDLEEVIAHGLQASVAESKIVIQKHQFQENYNMQGIHDAIILGIRDYFSKMGFTKAIIGSSGGIDSAVTLALACEAVGAENVQAVLMPSPYSTEHSVDDAVQLSKNLENPYEIIRIADIYESFLQTLEPVFKNLPFGLAEENMQSRIRGNLLMSVANKFGYILLNTSNKSELATGYGTLYGDMAGGLSVLGDIYKLQVYALAHFINRNKEIIPYHIIEKAPSAELRPNQKDSDSLPDYQILDPVLYQYIEQWQGPREIIAQGYDAALVSRILKLVNTNEYKRNQFCPIIRVSSKAFGVGRRVPIVGKYLS